jgi:hypothetical protein
MVAGSSRVCRCRSLLLESSIYFFIGIIIIIKKRLVEAGGAEAPAPKMRNFVKSSGGNPCPPASLTESILEQANGKEERTALSRLVPTGIRAGSRRGEWGNRPPLHVLLIGFDGFLLMQMTVIFTF